MASTAARTECEAYWWNNLYIDPDDSGHSIAKDVKRKAKPPKNPRSSKTARIESDLCDVFIDMGLGKKFSPVPKISVEEIVRSIEALNLCQCLLPSCVTCVAHSFGNVSLHNLT